MNFLSLLPAKPFFLRVLFMLALVLAGGCHRDQIAVYTVPKETNSEAAPEKSSGQPGLGYVLPDGWKELEPSGMVVLKLAAPGTTPSGGAEISAMQFPAKGVPTLDLVNIVRQNAGLPATTEGELKKDVEPVEIGADKGSLIDLTRAIASTATNARVMLAVYPQAEMTWFFKLDGDSGTVAEQKPAFIQFLKSLTFTHGDAPMLDTHKGMGTNAKLPPRAPVNDILPTWTVPSVWQKMELSEMAIGAGLKAKFGVSGKDGAKAEINIGVAGGAPIMNINRWRGQLGLPPADGEQFSKLATSLDVQGGKAMLVDMTGTDAKSGQNARLVGVIVPQSGGTWFYKLMGDEGVVEAEKARFIDFVKTVNYANVP